MDCKKLISLAGFCNEIVNACLNLFEMRKLGISQFFFVILTEKSLENDEKRIEGN